jgi:hypothetical protein
MKGDPLAKNRFTFEKRRKELEKKKKKEAKRQARLEKKAAAAEAAEAGEVVDKGPPIVELDENGLPVEPPDEDEAAD